MQFKTFEELTPEEQMDNKVVYKEYILVGARPNVFKQDLVIQTDRRGSSKARGIKLIRIPKYRFDTFVFSELESVAIRKIYPEAKTIVRLVIRYRRRRVFPVYNNTFHEEIEFNYPLASIIKIEHTDSTGQIEVTTIILK